MGVGILYCIRASPSPRFLINFSRPCYLALPLAATSSHQHPLQFSTSSTATKMNRPRNRQPRPPRGNSSRGGGPPRNSRAPQATPQQAAGTVPTVAQVIPGAPVFIILKDDQPTGEETAGVVQDILTRGNHPRGIKVRLRGGLVGRVQRMGNGGVSSPGTAMARVGGGGSQFTSRYEDVRNDEYLDGPPPRSLADFVPDFGVDETTTTTTTTTTGVAAVKCPFCEGFEGDETAVTHHIDQEHLS